MLSPGDNWEGVILTSPEEVSDGEIPVVEENIEIAVERAIQSARGFDTAVELVFGIDPGPRPGLAWLADGMVVGSAQLEKIESLTKHIIALSTAVVHNRMCVKIGDGAPLIRDRIINELILHGIETLEVSEHKTSFGSRSKAHLRAATRIALMSGTRVYQIRELVPTDGDLREIKRQSRIHSSGDITISTELAKMVACGEITMQEAIKRA
jgi:hypothetical protein